MKRILIPSLIKGSAIFFHVSSSYTSGCVGISQDNMVKILKWINPIKVPKILLCPEKELKNY